MEVKKLSFTVYWSWKIGVNIFYYLFHFPLLLIYRGKGKTVPPATNPILFKSATKLGEEIREGKIKSKDVVTAYIERIKEVEPFINAVAERRFEEAIQDAKKVDELLASGKFSKKELKDEKPFLGVPFTVKVILTVKGLPSTAASPLFKDVIAADDAPTVALMKKAGAIVLGTTNSAEFGLGFDTMNHLYGKTRNPYDTNRTPGGSSGGEGALLGAAGSVIGLGSDMTGSVRVPAHFTGVFSHKPSLGMVSNAGSFPAPNAKASKYVYTGPMCRYSEDLATTMKVLTSTNSEKIKFGQPVNFKNLKIYYQIDLKDPSVQPVDKEIRNAMMKAISHFCEKYDVIAEEVDIKLLNMSNMMIFHLLLGDVPNIVRQVTAGKITHVNANFELFKNIFGKSIFSLWSILGFGSKKYPVFYQEEYIPLSRQLLQKLDDKFDTMLDDNSVFFYPTFPYTAPRYYEMIPLVFSAAYTGIFNFLGLPSTQCPLGLNKSGMPHGMQIVGKRNNDPLTIACAEELGKVFGGWIPPC